MKMMKKIIIFLSVFLLTCGLVSQAASVTWTSTPTFQAVSSPDRTLVIISDLHVGIGRSDEGSWYPTEDFRWQKALNSFLDEMSRKGNDRVDLIIDGDFLEMWQPPANIRCEGPSTDLGCTVDEMKAVTTLITKAHEQVFTNLREFSRKGENRLYIIPGNHDSALLIAAVWEPVGKALGAESGRVNFVSTGVWISTDGHIVIEHGHQIGSDANRYDTWPNIVRAHGGKEYIIRSWGEQFVQKIFNEQENNYPIIDNLSPETAGIRFMMSDRGLWGTGTDIAKFVAFNLFQTSLRQKVQILGDEGSPEDKPEWNITKAREQGHRLFIAAMSKNDDFSKELLGNSEQAKKARLELDALTRDVKRFPDENVNMLCDQAAILGNSICSTPVLGTILEKTLVPRERVLATYLQERKKEFPKMWYFVYGHTHLLEKPWRPDGLSDVQILNTGAFQRLIDEEGYLRRVNEKKISPAEGLKKITLEEFPHCYTFARFSPGKEPEVLNWVMEEASQTGITVQPGDNACK